MPARIGRGSSSVIGRSSGELENPHQPAKNQAPKPKAQADPETEHLETVPSMFGGFYLMPDPFF